MLAAVALAVAARENAARRLTPRASGSSAAPSRTSPASSATRPRSAAPPTSTRACSTASTATSRSGGVIHRLPDDASEWPEVQAAIERGVLDLLEGREESRAVERIEPDAVGEGAVHRSEAESRFVEVEGLRLHYVEQGDGRRRCCCCTAGRRPSYLWRNVMPVDRGGQPRDRARPARASAAPTSRSTPPTASASSTGC